MQVFKENAAPLQNLISSTNAQIQVLNTLKPSEKEARIPVKFIVCKTSDESSWLGYAVKTLAWLAPSMLPEYGCNHVGIMIGNWQFDFTNNSLVIPTSRAAYGKCVLCLDLGDITSISQYETMMDEMAKACVMFNTEYYYARVPKMRSQANCHTFTNYVINFVLGDHFKQNFQEKVIRKSY